MTENGGTVFSKGGIFTISLDFELYWGMRDVVSLEGYRENLEGTPDAVYGMLELFEKYRIHTTWATVGFLFFPNRQALLEQVPDKRPAYEHKAFDLYDYLFSHEVLEDRCHFAPELIDAILQTPHQELATHTFSHYYSLEKGQTLETFHEDLRCACETMARQSGSRPKTLVFPRNQWNEKYLKVLEKEGIVAYRGTEKHWVYDASDWEGRMLIRRMIKLLDSYINVTGYHTYPVSAIAPEKPLNIPSSLFWRPYSAPTALLERLKVGRIKRAMLHAAKRGEVFHLWWHPHNFGRYTAQNLRSLEEVLRYFTRLRHRYGMRSLTMAEIAEEVERLNLP